MEKQAFVALVASTLAEHPHWLAATLAATGEGMSLALDRANTRAATKDVAMVAALALASPGRLTAEMRETLRGRIAQAIDPQNASELERRFLTFA